MTSLGLDRRAPRAAKGFFRLLVAAALLSGPLVGGSRAHAICRVVESEDAAPVSFDATTSAFFVLTEEVVIDYRCPEDDEAVRLASGRAARELGASLERGVDVSALPPFEALGLEQPTPSTLDAGTPDGGGLVRVCRDGTAADEIVSPVVSLVIQPRILEGGGHAGLVMPVAARPDVALGPSDAFSVLAAMATALSERVHETVIVTEDRNLGFQCTDPHYSTQAEPSATDEALAMAASVPLAVYGCGASDSSSYYRPGTGRRDTREIDYGDEGSVSYEIIPVSDAYSVTVLSASSLEALTRWMDENGFAHDAVDDEAFGAYVGEGKWFVALDVHPPTDVASTELGVTGLAPLVVTWPGDEIPIQNRLQFDPDGGTLITDAFVFASTPVDAEDGSALTIAMGRTELTGGLASFGAQERVLTQLRVARQQTQLAEDSRIVPLVGVAPAPPVTEVERTTRIRIPFACCQGGGVAPGSASARTFTYERTYDRAQGMPPIPEAWFHTPEHDSSQPYCQVSRSDYGGYFCAAASAPVSGFGPVVFAIAWLLLRRRRGHSRLCN